MKILFGILTILFCINVKAQTYNIPYLSGMNIEGYSDKGFIPVTGSASTKRIFLNYVRPYSAIDGAYSNVDTHIRVVIKDAGDTTYTPISPQKHITTPNFSGPYLNTYIDFELPGDAYNKIIKIESNSLLNTGLIVFSGWKASDLSFYTENPANPYPDPSYQLDKLISIDGDLEYDPTMNPMLTFQVLYPNANASSLLTSYQWIIPSGWTSVGNDINLASVLPNGLAGTITFKFVYNNQTYEKKFFVKPKRGVLQ